MNIKNEKILDVDIVVVQENFSTEEQAKFDEIMPEIEYLLRHSTIQHIKEKSILPSAFQLREFNKKNKEKSISFFQMLDAFKNFEEEVMCFILFLENKKSKYLPCDKDTRILKLLKSKLKNACIRDKEILDFLSITKSNNSNKITAHHWDIKSKNDHKIQAIYHILSNCCDITSYIYDPSSFCGSHISSRLQ